MTSNVARRSGWTTFAGVIAIVAGGYNALSGIGALSNDDTIASQAQKVLYGIDLTGWGWLWLIIGLLQVLAGVLILQGNQWGRLLGITMAGMSAIVTVFVIFIFPLWSIAVLVLDCLVLYALITQGDDYD